MEEFLNRIHYGLFLWMKEMFRNAILKNVSRKKLKNEIKIFYSICDPKEGYIIGFTNHLFGYFYSGYSLFFSFILFGIKGMLCEIDDKVLTLIILGVPVFIGYIPAYRAVFTNDNYLKYYKKFEKKDARWHKKCKWITVAFCVGSILATALGFLLMAVLVSI